MIEITYLDASKQERTMTFESYDEFERSQHACLIGVADYYPVQIMSLVGYFLDSVVVCDTDQAGMLRTFKVFIRLEGHGSLLLAGVKIGDFNHRILLC